MKYTCIVRWQCLERDRKCHILIFTIMIDALRTAFCVFHADQCTACIPAFLNGHYFESM